MQRVAPCLMFVGDQCGQAQAAMELYVAAFADAAVLEVERLDGDGETQGIKRARLRLGGQEVQVMDSPGPHAFGFTPAISLMVECDRDDELDAAWTVLTDGGQVLMPLQAYDFSPRFGWVQDRFGVSWQLNRV